VLSCVINLTGIVFMISNIYRWQLIVFYVSYYTYRHFNPIRPWQSFRENKEKSQEHSYFSSQKTVFEDESIN